MLEADKKDEILVALKEVYDNEFKNYLSVWQLMTPERWEFFASRAEPEYRQLKQCLMLKAAKARLKEAWDKKIKPLLGKRGTAPKNP